jgi:hypothetical protein
LPVLEGAARELLGVVSDAAIVKIDRDRPRLSYLEYPGFDDDPHPELQRGVHRRSSDSQNRSP